jgi:hypothetical protein
MVRYFYETPVTVTPTAQSPWYVNPFSTYTYRRWDERSTYLCITILASYARERERQIMNHYNRLSVVNDDTHHEPQSPLK